MKVLCCLLNWRTADMSIDALTALVREVRKVPGSRICVVDNDSQDGSFEKLRDAVDKNGWNDVAEVVDSGYNGGFGFGNNVALRKGLAAKEHYDAFYLLNSDAFPDEGSFATLVNFMRDHPRAGIVGGRIKGLDGVPHHSAFRFPNIWSEIDRAAKLGFLTKKIADKNKTVVLPAPPDEVTEVDWVAGASMMIRREVLEQVGMFDETYFLYYEETDLCLRAQRAGWKIMYVPTASVAHIGGASTGVTSLKVVPKPMPKYVFESRRHYFLKNFGRPTLWAANLAYAVAGASFRVRRVLQGKEDPERPREYRDWVLFNLKNP
jgi:N-acetylglucosaminyl-diphospho-decaprenol L-rhamnosyltransferase